MHRLWLITGALAGLIAVGLSAWAAHGLPARLDAARMAAVQNALTMQGWHALALLIAGLIAERGRRLAHIAAAAFLAGMILFCGAVWAGALMGQSLGPIAPLGGMLFMLGWAFLALAAARR
ncbi:MAG: DUF423 domain-containing protein [Roseomonas sp.]|jgi:uncharacterized membrane protein YgdD (TMEM256/DUF423 family)|nr:DUF423 domain-containing protein [Roseomonas sp.]MCA3285278.1 DUF423 domain-containing protein [Roseomonas sp.]MCA3288907.1 DUF423 domain-containing protein [Roseomonas sp.]MCA3294875.1 DUF423 domain-containing protein [Roseomonas sp.]